MYRLLFIAIICFLSYCHIIKAESITKISDNNITVIIKKKYGVEGRKKLSYFTGVYQNTKIISDPASEHLYRINSILPVVEINITYENGVDFYYPASVGDTITIDVTGNIPFVQTTNKDSYSYDYNWIGNYYKLYGEKSINLYKYKNKDKSVRKKKRFINERIEELKQKEKFLNEKFKVGMLSAPAYNFYSKRILLDIVLFKIGYFTSSEYDNLSEFVYKNQDTYYIYSSCRGYIRNYVFHKSEMTKNMYDPRMGFDWLKSDTLIKLVAKTHLMVDFMTMISFKCRNNDFFDRVEYMNSILTDDRYNNIIKSITPKKTSEKYSEDEVWLKRIDGTKTGLSDVLKRHKGKVIYIDLWASWCAPCCSLIPKVKQIAKDYSDKGLVVVYLAFMDKEKQWMKGVNRLNLTDEDDSYLILNSMKASLLKKLKVRSIPRYLLIDKSGNISNTNAPDPKGKSIHKELLKLL
ncbi:MAG: TlpA family protein disulfide reductase [Bacteroidales bacterium]|jgi:thiol-disulfide isomerase/thioredoxin|nr:TlpA family protein disulfide reductase [Bacteroidales bacterium]